MPSYIVHLCLAKEYIRKHGVEDENEFMSGTIYPDSVNPKGITHYSPYWSSDTNLYQFLLDKKLDSSYQEGYFLHLLADCLFYNKYFHAWRKIEREKLMHDFDILSTKLVKQYHLTNIPEEAKKHIKLVEGKTIEYHYDKVVKFIDEVSTYDIHKLAEEILLKKDYQFLL